MGLISHDEVESVLNDYHSRACGGHLSDWQPRRKSAGQDTSGPHYSKTVLRPSRSARHANSISRNNAHIQLPYIPLLLSAPLQNGGLTSFTVALPQPGGIGTPSSRSITLQNGMRQCLHSLTTAIWPHYSFLIIS